MIGHLEIDSKRSREKAKGMRPCGGIIRNLLPHVNDTERWSTSSSNERG